MSLYYFPNIVYSEIGVPITSAAAGSKARFVLREGVKPGGEHDGGHVAGMRNALMQGFTVRQPPYVGCYVRLPSPIRAYPRLPAGALA